MANPSVHGNTATYELKLAMINNKKLGITLYSRSRVAAVG
jgi:hypothetical protein